MMGQLNYYPGIWGNGAMANYSDSLGLLARIHEAYGIAAFRIRPFGPVWRLSAPGGEYGLKRFKLCGEQLQDLAGSLDGLRKAGFPHLAQFLPTKSGAPWITLAGRNYILSPWYDGANPDFKNPEHLTKVARLFGKLHSVSAQLAPAPNFNQQIGLLKYRDRTDFLSRILETLNQRDCSPRLNLQRRTRYGLNRIDRGILKSGPQFLAQAEVCMKQYITYVPDIWLTGLGPGARPVPGRELLPAGFCHQDPASRNLILHGGELILIDFELSGPDLFIHEVTTLLNRSLEANQWNEDVFWLVVNAYQMERPLSPLEIKLLPYLLLFPQRFWRICRQRYEEDLHWTEKRFARRFHQIIDQEANRVRFLKKWFPHDLQVIHDSLR
ncbi:MAG TPA: phosphotransferase [Bacillota bacterium]|nr:phosphotransferase [Bacillota bacterium]